MLLNVETPEVRDVMDELFDGRYEVVETDDGE